MKWKYWPVWRERERERNCRMCYSLCPCSNSVNWYTRTTGSSVTLLARTHQQALVLSLLLLLPPPPPLRVHITARLCSPKQILTILPWWRIEFIYGYSQNFRGTTALSPLPFFLFRSSGLDIWWRREEKFAWRNWPGGKVNSSSLIHSLTHSALWPREREKKERKRQQEVPWLPISSFRACFLSTHVLLISSYW